MSITVLRFDIDDESTTMHATRAQSVVGIGNFDGVHRGHEALIDAVNRTAEREGLCASVLTFDPHPLRFFRGEGGPRLIYSIADRVSLLESLSIKQVLLQRFDHDFAGLSPRAFVDEILVKKLNARHVVVGHDFAFGARRAGTVETLRDLCHAREIIVEVIEAQRAEGLSLDGHPDFSSTEIDLAPIFSSTWIRSLVSDGEVAVAEIALGRPYHLRGIVRQGHQRGRQLGFPTANLEISSELCPRPGVYAGWLDWGSGAYPTVVSVGDNPTISQAHTLIAQQRWSVEAHVLQQLDDLPTAESPHWLDLYQLPVTLWFSVRLREMMAFQGLDELTAQISLDCESARAVLNKQTPPRWPRQVSPSLS